MTDTVEILGLDERGRGPTGLVADEVEVAEEEWFESLMELTGDQRHEANDSWAMKEPTVYRISGTSSAA